MGNPAWCIPLEPSSSTQTARAIRRGQPGSARPLGSPGSVHAGPSARLGPRGTVHPARSTRHGIFACLSHADARPRSRGTPTSQRQCGATATTQAFAQARPGERSGGMSTPRGAQGRPRREDGRSDTTTAASVEASAFHVKHGGAWVRPTVAEAPPRPATMWLSPSRRGSGPDHARSTGRRPRPDELSWHHKPAPPGRAPRLRARAGDRYSTRAWPIAGVRTTQGRRCIGEARSQTGGVEARRTRPRRPRCFT